MLCGRFKGRRQDKLAANVITSPRTCSRPAPYRVGSTIQAGFYIGAPRPMRSRVTAAGGRSPGLRVAAVDRLPRCLATSSGIPVAGSPLTVAGAAAEWSPRSLLIPLRGTTVEHAGSRSEMRQVERALIIFLPSFAGETPSTPGAHHDAGKMGRVTAPYFHRRHPARPARTTMPGKWVGLPPHFHRRCPVIRGGGVMSHGHHHLP